MRALQMPTRVTKKIISVSAILLLLAGAANAYTVLMHGGRRIEILSRFVVTPATLTYEVTEGIQITIPMAAIDIPATEKANQELPGSLLARAKAGTSQSVEPGDGMERQKTSTGVRRTITNRDLESLRRRRQESEAVYENTRKQLGLPSLEESRRRAAAEFDLATTELAQKRSAEKQTEDYWRGRAAALRTEMAAVDGEQNYIRAQLEEDLFATRFGALRGSLTSVGSVVEFRNYPGNGHFDWRPAGKFGGGRSFHGQTSNGRSVYVAPRYSPQLRARLSLGGGATRGQVFVNRGNFRPGRPGGGGALVIGLPNTVFGSSVQGYDFSYERNALITRFNELGGVRAGLNARWRELEDEARRAGVAPGWLRP
jgi:hypothetical protein